MSAALNAMVAAMIAEITRQDACFDGADPRAVQIFTGESIDLEKVARAGLEAVNVETLPRALCAHWKTDADKLVYVSPEGMVQSWPGPADVRVPLWTLEAKAVAQVTIDAILKEQP